MDSEPRKFAKELMIVGALLAIAPPFILLTIFGTREITGPAVKLVLLTRSSFYPAFYHGSWFLQTKP